MKLRSMDEENIKQSKELLKLFPENIVRILTKFKLRKIQREAVKKINSNLVVCSPTGSGKTWIAEVAMLNTILNRKKKVVYVVPLKALANEKYKDFKTKYNFLKIAKSTGDLDKKDNLSSFDLIIATSEKIDSLIRHNAEWLKDIGLVIADEIHLLNDPKRGPTLEIVLTHFKDKQIIGLSATIGNAEEIAKWLNAKLIKSDERPVKLEYGVLYDNKLLFDE